MADAALADSQALLDLRTLRALRTAVQAGQTDEMTALTRELARVRQELVQTRAELVLIRVHHEEASDTLQCLIEHVRDIWNGVDNDLPDWVHRLLAGYFYNLSGRR